MHRPFEYSNNSERYLTLRRHANAAWKSNITAGSAPLHSA